MHFWLQLAASLMLAALGVTFVRPESWFRTSSVLVPVLSIVAAAVLFRLGRGLPAFEVAMLSASEVRRLSKAYCMAAQNTAVILFVLFLAICLGLIGTIWGETISACPSRLAQSFTFVGIGLNAFALTCTISLVRGDLLLIRLQAELLEQKIKREHTATNKARRERARKDTPVTTPSGYGGLITPD